MHCHCCKRRLFAYAKRLDESILGGGGGGGGGGSGFGLSGSNTGNYDLPVARFLLEQLVYHPVSPQVLHPSSNTVCFQIIRNLETMHD